MKKEDNLMNLIRRKVKKYRIVMKITAIKV